MMTLRSLRSLVNKPRRGGNAWESATDEQREAAVEHERICEQREQALLTEYRAGKIDAVTYRERVAASDLSA
jgi:hypothetical protein